MGAVTSLNKKTYLSLCVSSTNVITIQLNGAKIHIQKKSHHYLIYSTEFFFISMELKNSFRLLKQKETPQNFKLVKSQTYKMI